jgi:hypothetical protein
VLAPHHAEHCELEIVRLTAEHILDLAEFDIRQTKSSMETHGHRRFCHGHAAASA